LRNLLKHVSVDLH